MTTTFDVAAFNKSAQQRIEEEARQQKSKLLALMVLLRELGYSRVNVFYSGSGDDGRIDHIDQTPATPLTPEMRDLVSDLAWDFTPSHFQDNDGGEGSVVFDVAERQIVHNHADYIMEREDQPTVELFLDDEEEWQHADEAGDIR